MPRPSTVAEEADDRALDRSGRDSILFQFTAKQLRDFVDPNHLLIRIDECLDFAKLVEPLEEYYRPDFGRPAIHPEVMVRALLISTNSA
jgi:transposase